MLAALTACRDSPPPGAPSSTASAASAAPLASAVSTASLPSPSLDATAASATSSLPTPAAAPRPIEEVKGDGRAMGTHLAFAAFTTPALGPNDVHAVFDAAIAEIVRIEKLMTTWDPASEVSRINAAAGAHPVVVGPETLDVIRESLHASDLSGGAFDITFQTLHGLWKFDQDLDPHPPSAKDVAARLKYLGYRHVKIAPADSSVYLDEAHVSIGLGGIAKGYAVDRASKVLLDAGLTSFYVQAGGDLYAHGLKAGGAPWISGIRDPRGPEGDYFASLAVTDHAFSTAGDYERSYVVDGKRYHHIIDPHTGYPATASRSVTIWAPTALLADEIDDAVFIVGPEKGLAIIEALDAASGGAGVGAVIVDAKNRVWTSKQMEGRLHPVHPPRDGI